MTRSDKRGTKSMGRSRDNWKKCHLYVILASLILIWFVVVYIVGGAFYIVGGVFYIVGGVFYIVGGVFYIVGGVFYHSSSSQPILTYTVTLKRFSNDKSLL